jgi:hypothetical protein
MRFSDNRLNFKATSFMPSLNPPERIDG